MSEFIWSMHRGDHSSQEGTCGLYNSPDAPCSTDFGETSDGISEFRVCTTGCSEFGLLGHGANHRGYKILGFDHIYIAEGVNNPGRYQIQPIISYTGAVRLIAVRLNHAFYVDNDDRNSSANFSISVRLQVKHGAHTIASKDQLIVNDNLTPPLERHDDIKLLHYPGDFKALETLEFDYAPNTHNDDEIYLHCCILVNVGATGFQNTVEMHKINDRNGLFKVNIEESSLVIRGGNERRLTGSLLKAISPFDYAVAANRSFTMASDDDD